jgi:hypothetical protein
MDAGTTLLACIAVGVLVGAASSGVTRRFSARAGVALAVVAAGLALGVIALGGESLLLPVAGSMLAFAVAASLLDPRPQGLFH